ncbi:MAG: BrnA antitoxin family protein [Spirochaetales bacterium]|nr:BrnA antitoxin family protein [Spirochaetales bacterium]
MRRKTPQTGLFAPIFWQTKRISASIPCAPGGREQDIKQALKQLKPSHYRPQSKSMNMENFKPIKKTVYVRIDADVLEWLKGAGAGYQTRLNSILRRALEKE